MQTPLVILHLSPQQAAIVQDVLIRHVRHNDPANVPDLIPDLIRGIEVAIFEASIPTPEEAGMI
jgi:hypothetical protein